MTPYLDDGDLVLYHGDVIETLRALPAGVAQTCVTSPPFFGLRDYGCDGQIGLEATVGEYVARLVAVFAEVWRVLRPDATCWVELGDSFSEKQLLGVPWLVAFALRDAGWYLRSDIVWSRPNPMPESVVDRPTKSHSYLFLLTKQPRYFYDADAIREPHDTGDRVMTNRRRGIDDMNGEREFVGTFRDGDREFANNPAGRNRRSVWTIPTQPFPEAHFATYPEELVRPCILAGTSSVGQCRQCGRPVPPLEYRHETSTTATMRGMRHDVPEAPAARGEILLEEVRERGNGSQPIIDQGLPDRPEGIPALATAGSPDGESRGLRDGASLGDGGAPWTAVDEGRGRPSSEWGQGRQSGREPRGHAEADSRSQAEAADQDDPMSALRRGDPGEWACPACGGREVEPQLAIDPFVGSGTTALVARKHGRRCIGIDLSAEYLGIAARRLQQLSLFSEATGE